MGDQIKNIQPKNFCISNIQLGSLEQESLELLEDLFFIYHHVFAQPKIFELILDYAIHDNDKDLKLKTIQALRLVQKEWLVTITNITRRNKECLFFLKLTRQNSLDFSLHVENHGKILDQFVSSMESRIGDNVPSFQLTIEEEFFKKENYDSLITCLQKCGEGLLALHLSLPASGMTFPGIFSNEPLSNLEKLMITFSDDAQEDMNTDAITNTNISLMLSSLLTRNSTILDLSFKCQNQDWLPISFEYLNLPPTLTNLELKSFHTPEILNLLARNSFPCLESLEVVVSNECELHDTQIFKVLNKMKETLKSLSIMGQEYAGPPRRHNQIQFPVMKKLETLEFDTIDLELTNTVETKLVNCLPELNDLTLHQTAQMWEAWTSKPLPTVTHLSLSLVNEDVPEYKPEYWLPVTLEIMQIVKITFPNVCHLTLSLNVGHGDTCGLKYMFMEMKNLTYLSLYFYGTEDILGSDLIDSVFIGVSEEMAGALRHSPEYWKNLELKDEIPSIRMLGELKSLLLFSNDEDNQNSLISDLTLEFGLLKMPAMEKLYLDNRFFISEKMSNKWKTSGRYLRMQYLDLD